MTAKNSQPICEICAAPLRSVDELCSNCLFKAGLDETVALPVSQLALNEDGTGHFDAGHSEWDYEILEEIAHGGMGVVYKARQRKLNRVVALKMLLAGAFARQDVLKRFLSEAEVVAHLDHPNIVPIYEIGRHDGQHYFSMKYIENGTLKDLLPSLKIKLREAVQLMLKVARAVHFAHQRGVLHRDIKPGNILIDAQGEPWVTDFGLAKRAGEDVTLTRTGAIMGTPAYMSPEQARSGGGPLTVAADVYSLGAVFYHLFTGRPPFDAEDPLELLQSAHSQEPTHPKRLNKALPEDLATICLKCLEKQPTQRYASAEALSQDLERWLDYQPIEARPSGFWERQVKWARRKPTIALLSVLVVLLFIFGVGGMCVQTYRKQQILETARKAAFELAMARAPKLKALRVMPHQDRVASVVFNRKGHRLLSSSKDQSARIWDPFSGELLLKFEGSQGALSQAEFSPDETKILTVSIDEGFYYPHLTPTGLPTASFEGPWNGEDTVRIWDAESGQILHALSGHSAQVTDARFSPDGQRVVTCSLDKQAIIWSVETGQPEHVLSKHAASIASAQFTKDGRFVVTTSLGKFLDIEVKEGPNGGVSRSANTLAEAEADLAVFWDVETGKPTYQLPNQVLKRSGGRDVYQSSRCRVHLSPKGRYAVTAAESPGNTCLWDLKTYQSITALQGHRHAVMDAVFSPDVLRVATACADHVVRVFRVPDGALLFELEGHQAPVLGVDFSSDKKRLLSVSADGTGKIWDLHTGYLLATLEGHQDRVVDGAFHPDGFHIATASRDHTIRIWASGSLEDMGLVFKGHHNGVVDLDWHPNSTYLASAARDRTARVWSLNQTEPMAILKGSGPVEDAAFHRLLGDVLSVAFSPDGNRLWTGSDDNDGLYQKMIGPISVGKPVLIPFTPARLWDWDNRVLEWGIPGLPSGVSGVYPGPNGRFVLVAPHGHYQHAGIVQSGGSHVLAVPPVTQVSPAPILYDVIARQKIAELTNIQHEVKDVVFSPDGKLMMIQTEGQQVHAFRLVDGSLVRSWNKVYTGHFLDVTTDSKKMFMGPHSMQVGIWDIVTGRSMMKIDSFNAPLVGAWLLEAKNQVLTFTHQGDIACWDAMNGNRITEAVLPASLSGGTSDYRVVRLSPDKRMLAMIPHDHRQTLEVWDVGKLERLAGFRAHPMPIGSLAFSPDSRWLATGSEDGTVKAWPVGLFVRSVE